MSPNIPLHHIFTAVPGRYDLINHIITWGLDWWWRRRAAEECLRSQPARVLDLACGTGDLGLNIAQLAPNSLAVLGLDYSRPMLEIAAGKAKTLAGQNISFIHGDAANLPFPDGSFDCVGISFAFRNLTYRNPLAPHHLAEVRRVLNPGGRYVIVESSQPESKLIRGLFHLYLRWFVYPIGHLLSGNKRAYHYLAQSAARFYTAEEVKAMLLRAGFREVHYHPLLFGAAAIHVAIK
ncbi:MAG TPA: ubiquinone/menaquinone biosynthesis methyltransferase [Dehalococcoidia bacterium]|jgi:demethylmenaquinone methyltransferase/2-methoxy-6-polyprenyl-1,4-benzoquinol methylase|nr:ubiquinone/menaquinone biosynthesis methyltransferase [Dehalococcoidia bacterium]